MSYAMDPLVWRRPSGLAGQQHLSADGRVPGGQGCPERDAVAWCHLGEDRGARREQAEGRGSAVYQLSPLGESFASGPLAQLARWAADNQDYLASLPADDARA